MVEQRNQATLHSCPIKMETPLQKGHKQFLLEGSPPGSRYALLFLLVLPSPWIHQVLWTCKGKALQLTSEQQ